MKSRFFLLPGVLCIMHAARADSPLTSTDIASHYRHIPAVAKVLDKGIRDPGTEEFRFLDSATVPLDQKIALINALGWGDSIRFDAYKKHIAERYKIGTRLLDSIFVFRGPRPEPYPGTEQISAPDLTCLAYFRAMTDYFHPMNAYYCAYQGVDKNPESMAGSYIFGLVLAQVYLNLDWCRLYQVMNDIRRFDGYKKDTIRPEAVAGIFDYMELYRTSCRENPDLPPIAETVYKKPEKRQLMESRKKYVDLAVMEIEEPEWNSETNSTIVRVKIINRGKIASIETNARLRDVDFTLEQAKKAGLSGDALKIIQENNERADPMSETTNAYLTQGVDYDMDFDIEQRIPPVKPGEIVTITFTLENHWIYDSNCEIEVVLDVDDNIQEKDEKNNSKFFIAWG